MHIPAWWPDVLRDCFDLDTRDTRTLQRNADALLRLSDHLNDVEGRRSRHTRSYLSEKDMLRAYLLYYTTANMLKPHVPFGEIAFPGFFRHRSSLRVLDLGCGPGAGLLGCHDFFEKRYPHIYIEYHGVDASQPALSVLSRIGESLRSRGARLEVRSHRADIAGFSSLSGGADVILMMNALNEISCRTSLLLQRLTALLGDGGRVVIVEPALRVTSRALLEFRDQAVREGWTVFSPCFRQAECPALNHAQDWCHTDVPWERPDFMATLDRLLGHVKLSLKFSYLVLSRDGCRLQDALDLPGPLRVVSEYVEEKGRSWCYMCGAEGRFRCRRNTRDASATNAAFDGLYRYAVAGMQDGEWRGAELLVGRQTVIHHVKV
jgi:SAM-dependent methyltransferase